MQESHPDTQTFLVLGSGEANWEGEWAGVWRRCISQTDFKEVISLKSEFMRNLREGISSESTKVWLFEKQRSLNL